MNQNLESDPYSETYFDALYTDNADPWHYQTRWYEQRKRDICLAVLPQAQYKNAIELGCGNGIFSELLTQRCQNLLSIDGNSNAVQLAKERLAALPQGKVIQGIIPDILLSLENSFTSTESFLNQSGFDLIVISEILYYLSATDIDTVITWIKQNLAIDGFVMTGETVHQRLHQAFNVANDSITFNHQSQIIDSDFLLDIWQQGVKSVASQENLI